MRRIVINLQNILFADAIGEALRTAGSDFEVQEVEKAADVPSMCRILQPYALLLEVTGSSPWRLEERLKLRTLVMKQVPDLKIVLLVDEKMEGETALLVRQAKKDGLIDQFFYGSISAGYLVALMDTL